MFKLVIVDDENEIRHALSNYIPWSEMGFEFVQSFSNGQEAYDFLKENKVDILLCDIKMPIMNGIELAEKVYKENLACKIVFLSAHKKFDYAHKALSFGVEDYVLKPTKYQELLKVFDKVRNKLESEKEVRKIDSEKKDIEIKNGYNNKIIKKIKNYIKNNYKTANLDEAAKKVHLSSAYLSKFFKDYTGENFSTYLNRVKMEKAKKYLSDINYHVYQISDMLGYSSPKNFSRSFKKYTGKTPSQFRKGIES